MAIEVVPATEDLVSEIELWLAAEEAEHDRQYREYEASGYEGDVCVRGFRCNSYSTKKSWREGRSPLDVLIRDGQTIGFLDGYDILEIHPDERGKGYGRVLAEFMIDRAWSEGRSVAEIEIAPRHRYHSGKRWGSLPSPVGKGMAAEFMPIRSCRDHSKGLADRTYPT